MISTRLNSEALCKSYNSFDECVICQDVCLKENSRKYMENVLTIDTPQTGYSYKAKICNVCLYRLLSDYDFRVNSRYIRGNVWYRPLPVKNGETYTLEVDSGWHNTDANSRPTYVLWHPCPRDLTDAELKLRRIYNQFDIYPFNSIKYKR